MSRSKRPQQPQEILVPQAAARAVALRYVSDSHPGLRRVRAGKGFRYVAANGKPVRDQEVLERIRALAIPPAWTDVWICESENGHLQATGRDARGRKQYRYHARWNATRNEGKYDRMIAFAEALPRIRKGVDRDLRRRSLSRERVLAAVVWLLEATLIRIGNQEYKRHNQSYGLTTMLNEHAEVRGATVRFQFKGKSGVAHDVRISSRRLSRVIRHCQDLPGEELFQYLDEQDQPREVESDHVNEYLQRIAGEEFTAKDFRTWAGTLRAACLLSECPPGDTKRAIQRNVNDAISQVAAQLGNTRAVCRKGYVHPEVIAAYEAGTLTRDFTIKPIKARNAHALDAEEQALLAFLRCLGRRTRKVG